MGVNFLLINLKIEFMKGILKLTIITTLVSFINWSCSDNSIDPTHDYIVAKIVGYDLNCSTCVVSFPHDNNKVKELIGKSINDSYNTTNLNKDSYEIDEYIEIRIKESTGDNLFPCITLYPTLTNKTIHVVDVK